MTELKIQSVPSHSYLGCYTDFSSHVLSATAAGLIYNEPQSCCQWCESVDTANVICGVEYGGQCYCDSTMPNIESASASDCNWKCPGDGSVACGGEWRLNIYSSTVPVTTTASPETVTAQLLEGYSYLGCYSDSSDRILRGASNAYSLNDPEYCCQWCQNVDNKYQWCGVQNGDQCFCGSTISGPELNSASAGDCNSLCPGGSDQQCGGSWHMNLYKATGVSQGTTDTTFMSAAETTAILSETDTSAPQPTHKGGLTGGVIAGIVIGAVAALVLLIAVLFLLIRRRRSQTTSSFSNGGEAETPVAEMLTQANIHELQTPLESPRVELTGSKSKPTIYEMDVGPR